MQRLQVLISLQASQAACCARRCVLTKALCIGSLLSRESRLICGVGCCGDNAKSKLPACARD
jgi:hypothetical protein